MTPATSTSDKSPFAEAADGLIALGYSVIPLRPRDKAPGERKGGRWALMSAWPEFRDRAPTVFELRAWSSWQDANIGMVLGTPIGQHRLIAVDIDSLDPEEVETIRASCPATPMAKRGAKGLTMFYRGTDGLKSRAYKKADKTGLADLLTGNATRQTVVPPSVHPYGPTYQWVCGPVPADQLPIFDETCLERLEDTLEHLGWNAQVGAEARATRRPMDTHDDDPTIWGELNDAALARLDAWVPTLDLYGLRSTGRRGGYEAVATWRPSSTGQRLEDRKRNLQIHPDGIRDFGAGVGYSPLDLVCAANNWALDDAFAWMKDRLDLHETPVFVMPEPVEVKAEVAESIPQVFTTARTNIGNVEPGPHDTGLVGEIADWILSMSRRPIPEIAMGAALCLVGAVAGRKFAGPTRSGTHLYAIGLAPTGAGKNVFLDAINAAMNKAGLVREMGPSQFMSYSAVVKRLERQPLTICAMDELGNYLARINNRKAPGHERAITGILRQAWGASFSTITTPEWAEQPSKVIHAPALTLFGVSTKEEFYEALQGGDISNGFLNRFLVFGVDRKPDPVTPSRVGLTLPEAIKDGLLHIYYANGALAGATSHNDTADEPMFTIGWETPSAQAIYESLIEAIEARPQDENFLARTAEMAVRIATICAIGRGAENGRVSEADMAFGASVAVRSAEMMITDAGRYMAENDRQAEYNTVLRLIEQGGEFGPGVVKQSELTRRVGGRIDGTRLKSILAQLEEGEKIHRGREEKTGGRPSIVYVIGPPKMVPV